MVAAIDWQSAVALAVALACAVWLLRTTLRPFANRVISACGLCPGCGPEKKDAPAGSKNGLIQIEPAEEE